MLIGTWILGGPTCVLYSAVAPIFFGGTYFFGTRYIIYCWFSLPTKNQFQIQQSLIVMPPEVSGHCLGAVTEESPLTMWNLYNTINGKFWDLLINSCSSLLIEPLFTRAVCLNYSALLRNTLRRGMIIHYIFLSTKQQSHTDNTQLCRVLRGSTMITEKIYSPAYRHTRSIIRRETK